MCAPPFSKTTGSEHKFPQNKKLKKKKKICIRISKATPPLIADPFIYTPPHPKKKKKTTKA